MLGALKVLQGLVERILEPLDGLDILYVHGVWSERGGGGGLKKDTLFTFNSIKWNANVSY